MDETFDKLRTSGKLQDGSGGPIGWGVFVVRNRGKPNDKGRVVVDTRGLNSITEDDAYPLPRQEDLLSNVKGKPYITTLDQIKSYYQRRVKRSARYLTAVVSHRGQEVFNVTPMGYKGSPPHQQRYMDKLLADLMFAFCYIDDIVIVSDT